MESYLNFFQSNETVILKTGLLAALLVATVVAIKLFRFLLKKESSSRRVDENLEVRIQKLGTFIILFLAAATASSILGFGIQGIFIATSSFFAIVGIAFFATWSILSNITSSLILHFAFPFRIGDRIEVDGDEGCKGTLRDITLFYLRIVTKDNDVISIPTNVAIQKTIRIVAHTTERDSANVTAQPAYAGHSD